MVIDFFNTKQILPKLWVARIQKYWEKRIPKNYPESSSEFNFVKGEELKAAVIDMESKIGTPDSIVTPDVVPENQAVGNYLGTYDVEGEAGVETLLSPEKLPESATGAVAYHYNEETKAWDLIDGTEVKDGYIWGTLDSFSPIAVFSFRKDSYVDDTKSQIQYDVYVCNGIATKVYTDEDGKIYAENAYGKKTEINDTYCIVGGSYDGSDTESTNVSILGAKLAMVVGGNWYTKDNDHKNFCKSVNVKLVNASVTASVTGCGVWCSSDSVNISVVDSEVKSGLGVQTSYYKQKRSNSTQAQSELGLLSKQWVKKSIIKVSNSNIRILYCAANNGYSYTQNAELYVDGGEYEYLDNGQSNGTVDNCYAEINNAKITNFTTNNRGKVGDVVSIVKGCTVENGSIFCDPTDSGAEMASINTASLDIDKNCKFVSLNVGSISNAEVTTPEVAKEHIGYLKVSRSADVTWTRNADKILKDIIIIK